MFCHVSYILLHCSWLRNEEPEKIGFGEMYQDFTAWHTWFLLPCPSFCSGRIEWKTTKSTFKPQFWTIRILLKFNVLSSVLVYCGPVYLVFQCLGSIVTERARKPALLECDAIKVNSGLRWTVWQSNGSSFWWGTETGSLHPFWSSDPTQRMHFSRRKSLLLATELK